MNGLQETNVYAFSGLSNGEYDNLNADTINTQELYIDGVLFDVSGIDLTNYVTTTQLSSQLTPINNNITDISNNVNLMSWRWRQSWRCPQTQRWTRSGRLRCCQTRRWPQPQS